MIRLAISLIKENIMLPQKKFINISTSINSIGKTLLFTLCLLLVIHLIVLIFIVIMIFIVVFVIVILFNMLCRFIVSMITHIVNLIKK